MQRQKEARSRDAEADEPNDAKAHNKAPQVRPDISLSLSINSSFL